MKHISFLTFKLLRVFSPLIMLELCFSTDVKIELFSEKMELLALQGPHAHVVLQRLIGKEVDLAKIPFLFATKANVAGVPCEISRCGYTGEDGFEVSQSHACCRSLMMSTSGLIIVKILNDCML